MDPSYSCVAVCCLGKQGTGYNELEGFHEGKENIRGAVAGLFMEMFLFDIPSRVGGVNFFLWPEVDINAWREALHTLNLFLVHLYAYFQ